ncbi:MAG TPA: group II intron reverse transcriptase/maturase [bacterium]|nr:group II intron reverse transcriptase/maturase [bacterium]
MEGRRPAKGNLQQQTMLRTQRRDRMQQELERVRQAARKDKGLRFTALLHHVYQVDRLREAYLRLKRSASPGVDGQTWQQYGEELEANLQSLSERLKRGAYRAKPVRRAYIRKADGGRRPLGVPTLEDKIVQGATTEVLNAIYEVDFLGFSYGFRPGRDQHMALDALSVAIERERVAWVLDADIRGFFDTIDHEWLIKFVEHRIGDQRVVRLIQKWLKAGVLEDGERKRSEEGTPQGGNISPLLANLYLHYVFDLWAHQWRRKHCRGRVSMVRYADDIVIGFEHRWEAEQFLQALGHRFAKFGLTLHPDKTRLIEFGRFARENRRQRGQGKPETFNFLGFTHFCGHNRQGRFRLGRRTMAKRVRAKLAEIKVNLKRRRHAPVPSHGAYLQSVLRGHYRYYGVPFNYVALQRFREHLRRLWRRALLRRSQKGRLPWAQMDQLSERWLPQPTIHHPYSSERFDARTQGRSRVRE